MDTADKVEVARLQERFNGLDTRVADIQKDQKAQNEKLDKLLALHYQRKGAQATLKFFMAAGGSSGFAALIAHFWDKLHP